MKTFRKYHSRIIVVSSVNLQSWYLWIPNNSYDEQSTIARFDPIENSWTKLGNLNVARRGHGVIQANNEFIVVGGSRDGNGYDGGEPTESCELNGESMTCTTREPQLWNFELYPELMLIPWNPPGLTV